ncbi:AAC(3) family N-acetyltransferase [Kitasatospora sp. NE20-6]|uniref:aminoglycoside N(3)-acetyltransferase n=1 Tax=Kitasatospora sp. NE20-6 TaxID=2859066 RepID=UPI0034DBE560
MYSRTELADHLRGLGVREGETLLVQASARAVGPVEDRTGTITAALRDTLGPAGTLVAYTATPENSYTSPLHRQATAGLDPAGLRRHRATMPPYDPVATPASPTMGRLAEEIRLLPGAVRSTHPQTSFAALGPRAEALTGGHRLTSHLGEDSPVGRLYDACARVLLVSVPWSCCTVLHLAEYRQPDPPVQRYGAVVKDRRGFRQWVHFDAPSLAIAHLERMAADLARDLPGLVRGRLGDAECVLMPIADAVDLATKWLLDQVR